MANIIELLQKLINHEHSARDIGNIAEAEAFAVKIQTLLTEHKLSMSEVEYQEQEQVDPIGHEYVGADQIGIKDGRFEYWLGCLATAVANNFFCHTLRTVGGGRSIKFVGRNSDRAAAVEMYGHLVRTATALCEKELQQYKAQGQAESQVSKRPVDKLEEALAILSERPRQRWTHDGKPIAAEKAAQSRVWKTSFLTGFANAISRRMYSTRRRLEASASTQAAGLILRYQHAVEQYIKDVIWPWPLKASPGFSGAGYNPYAAERGLHHGSRVSIKARTALTGG
jgi:hypothetical protein